MSIREHLLKTSELMSELSRDKEFLAAFSELSSAAVETLRQGGKILIAGNGGSASDSLHFTAELIGRFKTERPSIPCIALVANASNLTCIGNDYSFETIFARQIEGLGNKGDLFIGISTSGNSMNVIRACQAASKKGMRTAGLLGKDGGKMIAEVDISLLVPEPVTALVQEVHILVLHSLAEEIEESLFPGK